MKIRYTTLAAPAFALAALLAACGGGGSSGSSGLPPTGGGNPTSNPSSNPTSNPTGSPTSTPAATGTMSIAGLSFANTPVVFTCGCTGEGGQIMTSASGGYQVTASATAVPASAAPYTPPGHNIMVVGYASGSHAQAWTMIFFGTIPAHDLNLSSTPGVMSNNVTDTASTGAALYIYYEAAYSPAITGSDRTFDWFNFNQIAAFAEHLRTAPSTDEAKLMSDVSTAQAGGQSMYPGFIPTWNGVSSDGTNATLAADIQTVANDGTKIDATLPTPCPGASQCTGAPTP